MALPLGTYTIVNAFHKNFACLLNSNDGEPMVGTITSDSTYYKVGLPMGFRRLKPYTLAVEFEA